MCKWFWGLIAVIGVSVLVACSPGPATGQWSDDKGVRVEWKPAQPRFGDQVEIKVHLPDLATSAAGGLHDPTGALVLPTTTRFQADGVGMDWHVRVLQLGDWHWGRAVQTLWTIKSEAGEASDLKILDARGLWEGSLKQAPQPSASALPGARP